MVNFKYKMISILLIYLPNLFYLILEFLFSLSIINIIIIIIIVMEQFIISLNNFNFIKNFQPILTL